MKILILGTVMFLLATALIIKVEIQPAHCLSTVFLNPQNSPPTLDPYVKYRWNITIWLSGYSNIFGWRARLRYYPAAGINITGAWNAVGDPSYVFIGRASANPSPDIIPGTVLVGDSLLREPGENPPPEPAKLAIVEFEIARAPERNETLFTPIVFDPIETFFLDDMLSVVPSYAIDGDYTWSGEGDVAVTDIVPSKSFVCQGFSVSINATVENHDPYTETFNLTIVAGDVPTSQQWDTFWSMGDVNREGYIDDIDVTRIEDQFGWSGPPGSIPEDINSDGEVDIFDFNICDSNYGSKIWTHFNLGIVIHQEKIVDLPPLTISNLTFSWNTTEVPKGNYTLSAYAQSVPAEDNTIDNTFTDGWIIVTMVGDITGPDGYPDGKCDMRDIGLVANGFGANLVAEEADPKYSEYWHTIPCDTCPHSPDCDVVYDGKIDMKDIGTTARHFGETDP